MSRAAPCVLLCALFLAGCAGQADLAVGPRYRSHTERLSELPARFTISVGGETEPRMIALTLRGPVADATVTCDRWIDTTSLEGMLRSITRPEMSDQEKAFAIWHFVMDWCHDYEGHTCDDPLEYANVWGYSYCGPMAILTDALCGAAGVGCRYINPTNHGTTEMFWDGEWHLLDSSCRYYFLRRDNRTVASIHDLAQDNDLVTRTHDDVGRALKWGGDVKNDLTMWGRDADDWVTEDFAGKSTKWDPRVTLWRGEVLSRRWDSAGLWCRAHGEKPPYIYANGTVHYEPDLRTAWSGETLPEAAEVRNFTFDPAEGVLRPRRAGEPAALVFKLRTPYFMPRIQVMGRFLLDGTEARARTSLSVDGGKSWNLLREASGPGLISLLSQSELTQKVTHESPDKYTVLIRYELEPGASPTGCALTALAVHGDLQYYPKALPALRRGENTVTVKGTRPPGGHPAGGVAEVTYDWLEDLNITLDPERPRAGLPCIVTGRVTNPGDGPADGVRVRFYEGNPSRGGKAIAPDVVIPNLGPGQTKEVEVTWVPAARPSWYEDMTQLWMVVDPENAIAEADEKNNASCIDVIVSEKPNLVLLDPSFVTVAREGDSVTLTAAVRNWDLWGLNPGDALLRDVVVRFFDGDPKAGGKQIGTDQVIPKIVAGEYGWASVKWDVAGLTGAHKVHVVVDPDGRIPERFESAEHPYDEVVVDVGL